jgi:lysozyme family protein
MANHLKLKPFTIASEGIVITNNVGDLGGLTNTGITWDAFVSRAKQAGLPATMERFKNMTDSDWTLIFKTFWDEVQADRINDQAVANSFVDWVWGSGHDAPVKRVQAILNRYGFGIPSTGFVGDMTIAAINKMNPATLTKEIMLSRNAFHHAFVRAKPDQAKWIEGWTNRLLKLTIYNYTQII